MTEPIHSHRYTLRDLPLPAKLVATVFLLSVGLGYGSAMIQLHFKHASQGQAMPTVEDVVLKFSGVYWNPEPETVEPKPQMPPPKPKDASNASPSGEVPAVKIKSLIVKRCGWCHSADGEKPESPLTTYEEVEKYLKPTPETSQLHRLLTGPPDKWSKDASMVQAFTRKAEDYDDVKKKFKELPEAMKRWERERETEREAMVAWVLAGGSQQAFEADRFPLIDELGRLPLTEEFKTTAPAPKPGEVPIVISSKKRSAKSQQMSLESLTQSTHAHLLSFSMLYALTGVIFAFSTYPGWFRGLLAPLVLVAQVADIACWWLARLDGIGPYFAVCILATGGVVGLGLATQIVLGVLDLYAWKGKVVMLAVFAAAAGLVGVAKVTVIDPHLESERRSLLEQKAREAGAAPALTRS